MTEIPLPKYHELMRPMLEAVADGVELPRFGGQVSGLHGGECTGSDELLFVVDWAEVANR